MTNGLKKIKIKKVVVLPSLFHEGRQSKGNDGQIEEEKEGKDDELASDEDEDDSKSKRYR